MASPQKGFHHHKVKKPKIIPGMSPWQSAHALILSQSDVGNGGFFARNIAFSKLKKK